jgi:Carboxylesterase type B
MTYLADNPFLGDEDCLYLNVYSPQVSLINLINKCRFFVKLYHNFGAHYISIVGISKYLNNPNIQTGKASAVTTTPWDLFSGKLMAIK